MSQENSPNALNASTWAWAKALGIDDRSLAKKLAKTGLDVHTRKEFTASEVFGALIGELERAKIAEKLENVKLKKSKNLERKSALVKMADAQKLFTETLVIPVRQLLTSAPTTLDARVNPGDPAFARAALNAWVDESLKILTDNTPKK